MARQRYTAGQSIADLVKIKPADFADLPIAHQREIVSKLASAGNKRLKSLKTKGIDNSAVMRVNLSGGKFSTKGKDANALTKELERAKRFLKSEQSTVKGWERTQAKLKKDLEEVGITTKPETGLAYSLYDLLNDYNQDLTVERSKYDVVQKIEDDLKNGVDPNKAYQNAETWLKEEYERRQAEYNAMDEYEDTPLRFQSKRYTRKRKKR